MPMETSSSFDFPGIPTYFQDLALVDSPHFRTFVGRFGWWQVLSLRRLKDWKRHWPLSPFGSTKPVNTAVVCFVEPRFFLWQAKSGDLWASDQQLPRPQNPVIIHNIMVLKGHLFFYRTPISHEKTVAVPQWCLHPFRYLADWLSFWTSKAWLVFLQKLMGYGYNDVYFGADFNFGLTFGLECLPDIYPSWVSNLKGSTSSVRRSWESWLTCPSSPKLAVEAIGRKKKDPWLRVWTNQLYNPHSLQ